MESSLSSKERPITTFFQQKDSTSSYSLRNFLRRNYWPQLLCLQEVKIAPQDERTQRALGKAANPSSNSDDGPAYKAYFCLPRDRFNAKGFSGKVYGVATFIRADFWASSKAITKPVAWDLEGRVLITEIPRETLAVVNGYWVNGTENPYRDPQTGEVVGTRHDRKREFHNLMLEEGLGYVARGWKVRLIGDINIARGPLDGFLGTRLGKEHVKNRADFNSKFFIDDNGFKGLDFWRHFLEKRGDIPITEGVLNGGLAVIGLICV